MAMALTEENVAQLPSDGSRFSSFFSSSESSKSTIVVPPAVRLEEAKKSVLFYMRGLYNCFGAEGRRILRNDELYIAGQNDVRFRDSGSHLHDMDNPDYWEEKERFFHEKYSLLYNAKYPFPPIVIDPESPSMIRQAEIDRVYFRWARKTRYIEAWISATRQELSPRVADNNTSSQRLTPPSTSTSPIETNLPSITRAPPGEVTVAAKSEPRASKRKRPDIEHEYERANSKKCVQAPLSQQIATKKIGEPTKAQPTRKNGSSRSPSRPVALRRSARIAALPKIKYY
ncbi:hypothetical protein F4824DRAFT_384157 [Ustulina deusta]|nr:hypothetical protein F4824DRAFT_384157 [Ustulina deusta]